MTARRKRLLVVEDEATIRDPMVLYLSQLGYEADGAENGVEALDVVKRRPYDLIILDLRMPCLDGRSFCRLLQDEGIDIPILVATAVAEHQPVYREAGRLIKSFSLAALREKVEDILGGRAAGAR